MTKLTQAEKRKKHTRMMVKTTLVTLGVQSLMVCILSYLAPDLPIRIIGVAVVGCIVTWFVGAWYGMKMQNLFYE